MSCVVRLDAFEQLASVIGSMVPELAGNICAWPSEPTHRLGTTSLAINPTRFRYQAAQAGVLATPDYATQIEVVGQHQVDIELRLNAPTMRQRAILEDKVLQVFTSQELSPGILSFTMSGCWSAVAAFQLSGEDWAGERVFDKKWYTTIDITGFIPALVTRGGVYTIEQLRLGLMHDATGELDATRTPATFLTDDDIEVAQVEEDGTYSVI